MEFNHKGFGFVQQEVVSKQNRKNKRLFFFFKFSIGTNKSVKWIASGSGPVCLFKFDFLMQ